MSELKFTGERIVPQADNCEPKFASRMFQEHIARYNFAAPACKGKSVIDIGCGVGYGSQRLAQSGAESVFAFDISGGAIGHAKTYYSHPNLQFDVDDAEDFEVDRRFDVAICFELIEHVNRPELVFRRIIKALKPDGLLIMSTPRALDIKRSPFHTKEFSFDEMSALMSAHFASHRVYVENNHFVSMVTDKETDTFGKIEYMQDQFGKDHADVLMFVACRKVGVPLPELEPVLVVNDDTYVSMLETDVQILHKAEDDLKEKFAYFTEEHRQDREFWSEHHKKLEEASARLSDELAALNNEKQALLDAERDLRAGIDAAEEALRQATAERDSKVDELQAAQAAHDEALRQLAAERDGKIEELQAERAASEEVLRQLAAERDGKIEELQAAQAAREEAVSQLSAALDQQRQDAEAALATALADRDALQAVADERELRANELKAALDAHDGAVEQLQSEADQQRAADQETIDRLNAELDSLQVSSVGFKEEAARLENEIRVLNERDQHRKETVEYLLAELAQQREELGRKTAERDEEVRGLNAQLRDLAVSAEARRLELELAFTAERDAAERVLTAATLDFGAREAELIAAVQAATVQAETAREALEGARARADALAVRLSDADTRRLEAYEYARSCSAEIRELRSKYDNLRNEVSAALEGQRTDAAPRIADGHPHSGILQAVSEQFPGLTATRHLVRDELVDRISDLYVRSRHDQTRLGEAEARASAHDQAVAELHRVSQRAAALEVRLSDADARRTEAYEYARGMSAEIRELRSRYEHLRDDISAAIDRRLLDVTPRIADDHRHAGILQAVTEQFPGLNATRHLVRDDLADRINELHFRIDRDQARIAELNAQLHNRFSWIERLTDPFGARSKARGDAARDRRSWAEAAEQYRIHLRLQPDNFPIWVQLGHMLKEAGRLNEAFAAYEAAYRLDHNNADLLLNWGHLRKLMGNRDGAIADYRRSAELDGNRNSIAELEHLGVNTDGLKARGALLGQAPVLAGPRRRSTARARLFDRLSKPAANRARRAGDAARDRGDWRDAAIQYAAYIRLRPADFGIRVQLGHALKESGRWAEALVAYNEAARLEPDNADLLLNLGHLHKVMGNTAAAISAYRRSAELDGNADAATELRNLDEGFSVAA